MGCDQHRPPALEARRRPQQQAADAATIETGPANRLGPHEGRRIDPAGVGTGPALDLGRGDIDRGHVGRALRAGGRHGELARRLATPGMLDAADGAGRQHRLVEPSAAARIEEQHFLRRVAIDGHGERAAVGRERRLAHIAAEVGRQAAQAARCEVVGRHFVEFAEAVRHEVERAAVARPGRVGVGRARVLRVRRGQQLIARAGREVEPPDRRLGRAHGAQHRGPAVVRRGLEAGPAAAVEFGNGARRVGPHRVDQGERGLDRLARRSARAAIDRDRRDQQAVAPAGPHVGRASVGRRQRRAQRRLEVEAEHARGFVPAAVALVDDEAALMRLEGRVARRVGRVGQALRLLARTAQQVQLVDVGVGCAMAHQHRALRRMPVDEGPAAEPGVGRDAFGERLRDRRDAFGEQLRVRLDALDRRREHRRGGRCAGAERGAALQPGDHGDRRQARCKPHEEPHRHHSGAMSVHSSPLAPSR